MDEPDKAHRFLRGLGPVFSAAQMARKPLPSFSDLLADVESFALFEGSLNDACAPNAAFVAHPHQQNSGRGNNQSSNSSQQNCGRGNSQRGGRGRNGNYRRPKCQLCRGEHYANKCSQLQRYARNQNQDVANLV